MHKREDNCEFGDACNACGTTQWNGMKQGGGQGKKYWFLGEFGEVRQEGVEFLDHQEVLFPKITNQSKCQLPEAETQSKKAVHQACQKSTQDRDLTPFPPSVTSKA